MKKMLILLAMVVVVFGSQAHARVISQYAGPGQDNLETLMKAASTGDIGTLTNLLAQDQSLVNERSSRDYKTALHIACMTGKYDAVKLLLARGANPNMADIHCKTPYYYAKTGYWYDIQRLLRKRGAKREYITFFPHCCTEDHPNPKYRKGYCKCTP